MNLPLEVGQLTDSDSILCPYHNSEFCYKTGEVKKWIGIDNNLNDKNKNLTILRSLSHDSYVWVEAINNEKSN